MVVSTTDSDFQKAESRFSFVEGFSGYKQLNTGEQQQASSLVPIPEFFLIHCSLVFPSTVVYLPG
jgi:hypothetical protein